MSQGVLTNKFNAFRLIHELSGPALKMVSRIGTQMTLFMPCQGIPLPTWKKAQAQYQTLVVGR